MSLTNADGIFSDTKILHTVKQVPVAFSPSSLYGRPYFSNNTISIEGTRLELSFIFPDEWMLFLSGFSHKARPRNVRAVSLPSPPHLLPATSFHNHHH